MVRIITAVLVSLTSGEKVGPVSLHCSETLLDNSNLSTEGLLQILSRSALVVFGVELR